MICHAVVSSNPWNFNKNSTKERNLGNFSIKEDNSTKFNELFRKEIRSCRIGANTR